MSTARRYVPRYSWDDYRQWQGDWQLIDGVAIAMTPSPFGRHEQIVANFVHELMSAIDRHGCDCRVYAGFDWIISNDTVLRPDVMVVCGSQPERHLEGAPELVVEVLSPSTVEQDRHVKRGIYFDQGVTFYLIVDPESNAIELLQRGDTGYQPCEALESATIRLPSGCVLELQMSRLLR
jgi:Uma2 family endonuclease